MSIPKRSALIVRSVLVALVSIAPVVTGAAELDLQAALDNRVAGNNGYGGGILRVQQGDSKILWQGVSGNWARDTRPIWPLHTFEIASITKTFTATLILQMHEDASSPVKLWTEIGHLLPDYIVQDLLVVDGHDYGPEIQIHELLQHLSGLPDYWNSQDFLGEFIHTNRFWYPDELIAYTKDMRPIGLPGEAWHYADTNYVLLGMIIESVTGEPLEDIYRHRILEPLGMTETYLSYRELPVSLRRESHRFERSDDLYGELRQSADWAGGGLVSNTRDLQKFMHALFQGRLFAKPDTLDLMRGWTRSDGSQYGLGLFRVVLSDGRGELWGHGGWGNSFMYYWPQQDIGFTGTLNQQYNNWYPLVDAAISQWLAP